MPNRLADEPSLYLRQHAQNPVEWWAWGPEAFGEAARRGVPIFLSIGYSTCYWCHVMERESFEDPATAAVLNEHFVAIKVDREERPDLDEIYMAAVQLLTRSGGWPMSVWITPPMAEGRPSAYASGSSEPEAAGGAGDFGGSGGGLRPFYAGTYFPPRAAYGRPSFVEVLENIARAWEGDRGQILEQADRLTEAIGEHFDAGLESVRLSTNEVAKTIEGLLRMFDTRFAGFGDAPKFPQPSNLLFLMEVAEEIEDAHTKGEAQAVIRRTLDAMAIGGIYDQLGGGFHRYSVDAQWSVPHFEKMLYDQGLLLSVYARQFRAQGDALDGAVVRGVCEFVLREMTTAEGAFASAIDAEVDAKEGLNYLWTRGEVDGLVASGALTAEEGAFAVRVFGVDAPNFKDPHHADEPARSVLRLSDRPEVVARGMGMDAGAFGEVFERVRRVMLGERGERRQPHTDGKVIVAWNGWMIAGLCEAAVALREPGYFHAAARAAGWILAEMRRDDGLLARSWSAGRVSGEAHLEDHAAMVSACAKLHYASGILNLRGRPTAHAVGSSEVVEDWLGAAEGLAAQVVEAFGEERSGVVFDSVEGRGDLILRLRSTSDGATPSGVSVWVHALTDLFELTKGRGYLERAIATLGGISQEVRRSPIATVNSTRGLARLMAHDGGLPDKLGAEDDAGASAPASPVVVMAAARSVELSVGEAVRVPIRFEIGEGFHMHGPELPGELRAMGLVPLRAQVVRGDGVEVRLVMPEAGAYGGGALAEAGDVPTLPVYGGVVEGEIELEQVGAASGRHAVVVSYQVCSDEACYAPITVELALGVRVEAGLGG